VNPEGNLVDCAVLRATPSGLGFELAATQFAPGYTVDKLDDDGFPTINRYVTFEIKFSVGA